MNLDDVHEDLREGFKGNLFFPPIHWPGVLWLGKKLFKIPSQGIVDGVTLIERSYGENQVRIYMPDGKISGTGLVILHGGGLIGGDPNMNDWNGSWFAKQLGAVVFSPEYRTAPENPAPAAINAAWAFWHWLQREADGFGVNKDKIVLSGVSAGGGLATCLTHRLSDENSNMPVCLVLTYPMLDDKTATDKSLDDVKHLMWANKANRVGWESYLGANLVGAASVPDYLVASRREDLSGLPPTFIGVGDIDLFYRENIEYAARLQQAGVHCETEVLPSAPHGFDYFSKDTEMITGLRVNMAKFMSTHLGPVPAND